MNKKWILPVFLLLGIGIPIIFSPLILRAPEGRREGEGKSEERAKEERKPDDAEQARQKQQEAFKREERLRRERDKKPVDSPQWYEKELELKQARNDYDIAQQWEEYYKTPKKDRANFKKTIRFKSLQKERSAISKEIATGEVPTLDPVQSQLDPYKVEIIDKVFSAGTLGENLADSNEWKLIILEDAFNAIGDKFQDYNLQKYGLDFLKEQIDAADLGSKSRELSDKIYTRVKEIEQFLGNPPKKPRENKFEQKLDLSNKIPSDQLQAVQEAFLKDLGEAKDSAAKKDLLEQVKKAFDDYGRLKRMNQELYNFIEEAIAALKESKPIEYPTEISPENQKIVEGLVEVDEKTQKLKTLESELVKDGKVDKKKLASWLEMKIDNIIDAINVAVTNKAEFWKEKFQKLQEYGKGLRKGKRTLLTELGEKIEVNQKKWVIRGITAVTAPLKLVDLGTGNLASLAKNTLLLPYKMYTWREKALNLAGKAVVGVGKFGEWLTSKINKAVRPPQELSYAKRQEQLKRISEVLNTIKSEESKKLISKLGKNGWKKVLKSGVAGLGEKVASWFKDPKKYNPDDPPDSLPEKFTTAYGDYKTARNSLLVFLQITKDPAKLTPVDLATALEGADNTALLVYTLKLSTAAEKMVKFYEDYTQQLQRIKTYFAEVVIKGFGEDVLLFTEISPEELLQIYQKTLPGKKYHEQLKEFRIKDAVDILDQFRDIKKARTEGAKEVIENLRKTVIELATSPQSVASATAYSNKALFDSLSYILNNQMLSDMVVYQKSLKQVEENLKEQKRLTELAPLKKDE